MSDEKSPEGGSGESGSASGETEKAEAPASPGSPEASAPPSPPAAPEAAAPPPPAEAEPAPTLPEAAAAPETDSAAGEDEGRESIEVEAVESKPQQPVPRVGTHRPPPPPSIRAHGTRGHFEVTGKPKLAQDLMSRKIFTIGPDDKLLHLEEHMEKFCFGHLPVVQDEKLVGLITHADLLHASASFLTQKAKELDEIIHSFPASRIMQRELITVRPTDTLVDVAKLMWEGKVGCVLVTDDKEKLVGIITEGDFIRLAHHFLVEDQKK